MRFTTLGEGHDWTYFVLSTAESRLLFSALLAEYGQLPDGKSKDVDWQHPKSWAEFVDHIDGIEMYGPDDRRSPTLSELTFDPVAAVDCLLWPAPSEQVAAGRINALLAIVGRHAVNGPRVRVAAVDTRPDSTVVRVIANEELLTAVLADVSVERVRAPLRATITQASISSVQMPADIPDTAATRIGIVDGVVNQTNPLTGPQTVSSRGFPASHVFAAADAHGTAVAGCAIWGDLDHIVENNSLPQPFPIVSARVLDSTPLDEYRVNGLAHMTIEGAIRWLVDEWHVRVVNLSINEQVPAESVLRNELTATVDLLARELNVVVVVSAGNRLQLSDGHWLTNYPEYLKDVEARVAAPGDAALAVTVGSYAARDVPGGRQATSKVAIARARYPSPFTRCGPARGIGRAGTLKPEFVHHGGNWSWDHMFGNVDTREPGTAAVVAITPQGGRISGSASGTSYAAPIVAREVARIAERYPGAGANLLRGLLALSARPIADPFAGDNLVHAIGYGEPDADRVLESSAQRVFLTYEGTIEANHVLVHRVPIPAEYADGIRSRTFRVALAFDPPVRRSRREYVAGTMTVELVRGISESEVRQTYSRQPSLTDVERDGTLQRRVLPNDEYRPPMQPGATVVESNTLVRREFIDGTWDPDHRDYFLVVAHNQSRWTDAQRASYTEQRYALALEIAEESASDLDLYQSIRAQLRARARARR